MAGERIDRGGPEWLARALAACEALVDGDEARLDLMLGTGTPDSDQVTVALCRAVLAAYFTVAVLTGRQPYDLLQESHRQAIRLGDEP